MNDTVKEGWSCPICKTIHSPETKVCVKCTQKEAAGTSTEQFLQE